MFRRHLTLALSLLAAAVVLQGLAAATALGVAQDKVQRGRVASDIQLGFVELKASKQRLRTPTTAIRGKAEVTLRGSDRPAGDYRAALTRIVDASRQLGGVIDDLLAMARSDIETLSLVRRPLDLALPFAEALAPVLLPAAPVASLTEALARAGGTQPAAGVGRPGAGPRTHPG